MRKRRALETPQTNCKEETRREKHGRLRPARKNQAASEAGIPFPSVITLQVDNAACEAYANQTRYSGRSRLRHIDARLEWLQCLRDSRLVRTTHVPSPENLSDWLTKPLKLAVFLPMRARMMHFARVPVASP